MNDGLQVATGVGLGRGTITILEGLSAPAAAFLYGNGVLRLRVKEDIVGRIRADIQKTIKAIRRVDTGSLQGNPQAFHPVSAGTGSAGDIRSAIRG